MGIGLYWQVHAARRKPGAPAFPAPLAASHATPTDIAMMARALRLARKAGAAGEVPVGAVIYRTADGAVVGEGANTRERGRDPAGHAEFTAIMHAARAEKDWRLDHCTLVVTLEPCAMCAGAIVNARVGRVIYGAKDPKAGFAGSLGNLLMDTRLNHRALVIAGVREAACVKLLTDFFARLRVGKKALKSKITP